MRREVLMSFLRKVDYKLIIVFICFGAIYCSISLVNHYLFRTFAWDLGIRNNAIYDYAHVRWNDCMLMQPQFENILSDHFTLITVLLSPLYWLFGTYTLLIVQIVFILLGGLGIYKYFTKFGSGSNPGLWACIHFFSLWGIYSALSFDFHENVLAAMMLPWFFYYFRQEKWGLAVFFFSLILISKENMALWGVFIGLGLMLAHFRNRVKRKYSILFTLLAMLYFVGVVKGVMPALANEGRSYLHFKYAALGNGFSEALQTILTRPLYAFRLLFINHLDVPIADGIKEELFYMVLCSGGVALLFRPQYLLMLVPIFAQKLYSDDIVKWGINYHYSIEFVPLLTFALFSLLNVIKKLLYKYLLMTVAMGFTLFSTIDTFDERKSVWYKPERVQFYTEGHYQRHFDVAQLHKVLREVPDTARVSALSPLVPHLAFRDYIYQFPLVADADYIVLLEQKSTYPMSREQYLEEVGYYRESPEWVLIYDENSTLIFQRNKL